MSGSTESRPAVFSWFDDLRSDLVYGYRSLRRRPGLLLAALLSLGLGIGATVAMFSVLDASKWHEACTKTPGNQQAFRRCP